MAPVQSKVSIAWRTLRQGRCLSGGPSRRDEKESRTPFSLRDHCRRGLRAVYQMLRGLHDLGLEAMSCCRMGEKWSDLDSEGTMPLDWNYQRHADLSSRICFSTEG